MGKLTKGAKMVQTAGKLGKSTLTAGTVVSTLPDGSVLYFTGSYDAYGDPVYDRAPGPKSGGSGSGGDSATAISVGEQRRQFDITNPQDEARFWAQYNQGVRQFDLDFGEGVRRFDLSRGDDLTKFWANYNEGVRQFDTTFAEGQRQFNLQYGLDEKQLAEQARQFDVSEQNSLYKFDQDLQQRIQDRAVQIKGMEMQLEASRYSTDVGAAVDREQIAAQLSIAKQQQANDMAIARMDNETRLSVAKMEQATTVRGQDLQYAAATRGHDVDLYATDLAARQDWLRTGAEMQGKDPIRAAAWYLGDSTGRMTPGELALKKSEVPVPVRPGAAPPPKPIKVAAALGAEAKAIPGGPGDRVNILVGDDVDPSVTTGYEEVAEAHWNERGELVLDRIVPIHVRAAGGLDVAGGGAGAPDLSDAQKNHLAWVVSQYAQNTPWAQSMKRAGYSSAVALLKKIEPAEAAWLEAQAQSAAANVSPPPPVKGTNPANLNSLPRNTSGYDLSAPVNLTTLPVPDPAAAAAAAAERSRQAVAGLASYSNEQLASVGLQRVKTTTGGVLYRQVGQPYKSLTVAQIAALAKPLANVAPAGTQPQQPSGGGGQQPSGGGGSTVITTPNGTTVTETARTPEQQAAEAAGLTADVLEASYSPGAGVPDVSQPIEPIMGVDVPQPRKQAYSFFLKPQAFQKSALSGWGLRHLQPEQVAADFKAVTPISIDSRTFQRIAQG